MNRHQRGLTLLELLVALSVFSIAAIAILDTIAATSQQVSHLEQRTLATWVASNQLEMSRQNTQWPNLGVRRSKHQMAGRDWFVSTKIATTARADMRRMTVEVRRSLDGPILGTREWFFGRLK